MESNRSVITAHIKKYGIAVLILLLGLALMCLPDDNGSQSDEKPAGIPEEENLERELQNILTLIDGAGKVTVLLTEKTGEEILYQTDIDNSRSSDSEERQSQTVLVSGSDRADTGLIRQINPPVLRGAVVVCQGAGDPKVKLAVVEAVMRATGLPSNCICVLKMK